LAQEGDNSVQITLCCLSDNQRVLTPARVLRTAPL